MGLSRRTMSERLNKLVDGLLDAPAKPATPKRSKYGAVATIADGIRFASKREAAYYDELKLMMLAGDIQWFARQARFVVEGGEYVCDYIVRMKDGTNRIVDTKGFLTPVYRVRKRQMKQRYGIEIEEIR